MRASLRSDPSNPAQLMLPGFVPCDRFAWKTLSPTYALRRRWEDDPETAPPVPHWWSPSRRAMAVLDGFGPRTKVSLRRWIEGDPTERVAQLAAVQPGVMVFVAALERAGLGPAARRIVRQVQAGVRLRNILRNAPHCGCATPCVRVAGWPSPFGDPRACNDQRHHDRVRLLLRAGPLVEPRDLLSPLPRFFAEADIPCDPEANRCWYRIMAQRHALRAVPREAERAVYMFLSRHALELARLSPACDVVAQMLDYCAANGRRPSRKGSPGKLLSEVARWQRQRARGAEAQRALVRRRFPEPPIPALECEGITIAPIQSAADLVAEGRALSHCVGSLAGWVLKGRSYFYSVRVRGWRSTLEVRRQGGEWLPHEHCGRFGADPLPSEREAVRAWLCALGEQ